jgi:signal transduction histidine kinase
LGGAATFDGVYLLYYVFPLSIIVMGSMLFSQMGKGLRVAQDFNLALTQEVADRTSALESALTSIRSMESNALSLTRNIPIGTFILQTWGRERARYAFFSDRLRQMINLPPDAEPPLLIRGSTLLHPDDVNPACDALHKAYDDLARFDAEFRIRNAAGDWRWLRCIMLPQPGSGSPLVWDGVVIDVTEARDAEERLRLANAGLVQAAADQSRMAEREHLLREMHDGFGSQLSSARLAVEQGDLKPDDVARILLECSQDLRIMVDTLGNEDGDLGNAVADFRYRTDRLLFGTGITTTWDIEIPEQTRLPPTVILHILRILQEAMNNALRHSGGRHLTLAVKVTGGQLAARVSDDGRGLQDIGREGRGMANMRKRCREIGARLEVKNTGQGTEVALTMDLPDAR